MANAAPLVFTDALVLVATSTASFSTTTATSTVAGYPPFDISSFVRRIGFTFEADEHDDTVMGLTSRSRVQGLFSWQVEIDLLQSFESSNVGRIGASTAGGNSGIDKLFYELINNKVKFNIFVRALNAARSSDNPEYSGAVRTFTHSPMTGNVGDLLQTPIAFRSGGNLSRTVVTS